MSWEFELGVILLTVLVLVVLKKSNDNTLRRFLLVMLAVLLFEYFTHPLWANEGLASWSYLYLDVNWIISLLWANLVIVSMAIVEYLYPKFYEGKKFLVQLGIITVGGLYLEWILLRIGVKIYPEIIQQYLDTTWKIGGVVPLIELIYIPTFMALVVGFVRYWELSLGNSSKKNKRKIRRSKK